MAGFDLPVRAIREQMASAIDCIVQLTRLRDGTRRITHITEVQGMEGDVITLQDVFLFDFGMGVDEHGRFRGHLKATGVRPKFAEKLADLGHPPRPRGVPARRLRRAVRQVPDEQPAARAGGRRRPDRVVAVARLVGGWPRTPRRRTAARSARSNGTDADVKVALRVHRAGRRTSTSSS